MHTLVRHVGIPILAPAALIALYFTPVTGVGCVNRGLLALAVVFISAATAFVTVGMGMRERLRGRTSAWWLVSTLILTLPLVLILGWLG